ncbi:MAG TPA: MFS transporter [Syntrophorhabdales bacterium]|nr:MFS transporter [Syntrophorhabdales bacterium]
MDSEAALASRFRRLVFASSFGTALENYDMFIYALIAPVVFDTLFFPKVDPYVGMILVFATFSVGFVARPLGSIVFGHFGDRIGRKNVLITTLLLMGIASTVIGILPSYARVGVWAPIFLVFLRICQGIAMGGETGGAAVLTLENAPTKKRGFYASCVQIGGPSGVVLASLIVSVLTGYYGKKAFQEWAWRIPFLLSFLLVIVGTYMRTQIDESFLFQKQEKVARVPIVEVFSKWKKSFFFALLPIMSQNVYFYAIGIFSIAFATRRLGMSQSSLTAGFLVANCLAMFTVPLYGHFSDRIGRRPFLMTGIALTALSVYPFFHILPLRNDFLLAAAIVVGAGILHPLMFSQEPSYTAELFATDVRYTGASVSKHLGSTLGGGLAPLIAASLIGRGENFTPVILYICSVSLAGFIAAFLAPESSKLSLSRER